MSHPHQWLTSSPRPAFPSSDWKYPPRLRLEAPQTWEAGAANNSLHWGGGVRWVSWESSMGRGLGKTSSVTWYGWTYSISCSFLPSPSACRRGSIKVILYKIVSSSRLGHTHRLNLVLVDQVHFREAEAALSNAFFFSSKPWKNHPP